MYSNESGNGNEASFAQYFQRISLREAQGVFVHRSPATTRTYFLKKGIVLYPDEKSQQHLNGEAKAMDPSQLWVDVSSVAMAVQSISENSFRKVAQSRLEEMLKRIIAERSS